MNDKDKNPPTGGSEGRRPSGGAGAKLADIDELTVEVEKLIAGGNGLARWQGIPIFVPRSAPGDRLRVRITDRRPDYGRAEIVEILEGGAGRREPPCPHFGRCGGCDLQHLDDDLQTRLKAEAVGETLTRLGGITGEIPTQIVTGSAWAYRHRAQIHTSTQGGQMQIGFRARQGSELVAVDSCPILVPELDSRLSSLAQLLPASAPRRLDLLVGDDGTLTTAPKTGVLPQGEIQITVGEFSYELDARCFFQAHRQLLPELVEHVVGSWQGGQAFDLYAGVGLFSLPLARQYENVTAVDGDNVAGRYLKRNARRNRFPSIEFVHSAVESWIEDLPESPDRVVVDPPRTGLSRQVCRTICLRRPQRLTYVSCHAATLARDLRTLGEVFEIEKLTLIDLIPQTGHMEVVAQLTSRPT